MDAFDSRKLRHGDNFVVTFTQAAAQFQYHLESVAGGVLPPSEPLTIEVLNNNNPDLKRSWDVQVRLYALRLGVDEATLRIQKGDTVIWHTEDPGMPAFRIYSNAGHHFDSAGLTDGSGYSHRVSQVTAGTARYVWSDPNHAGIAGRIRVQVEDAGNLQFFRISNGNVTPAEITVQIGQPVFWIVERTDSPIVIAGELPSPP